MWEELFPCVCLVILAPLNVSGVQANDWCSKQSIYSLEILDGGSSRLSVCYLYAWRLCKRWRPTPIVQFSLATGLSLVNCQELCAKMSVLYIHAFNKFTHGLLRNSSFTAISEEELWELCCSMLESSGPKLACGWRSGRWTIQLLISFGRDRWNFQKP